MTKIIYNKLSALATIFNFSQKNNNNVEKSSKSKNKSYHEMYDNVNRKFEKNITEETFFNILVSNFGKNKFINEEIISILFKKFHFEFKDLKQSAIDKTEINIIHNLLDRKLKFKDYEIALINQMKLNLTMKLFDEETQKKLKTDDLFLRECFKHTFEKEKVFNNFIKNYETKNDLDFEFKNKFNYVLENIKIINDMIKNNNIVKHHHHEFH